MYLINSIIKWNNLLIKYVSYLSRWKWFSMGNKILSTLLIRHLENRRMTLPLSSWKRPISASILFHFPDTFLLSILETCIPRSFSINGKLHFITVIQTLKRTTLRTERNALWTKRNALGTEHFAFLGTECFVRFGLVSNFPRYSDFLAWWISLLFIFATAKWE